MSINAIECLGGKHSKGESLVVAAEVAHLKALGVAFRSVGAVNTNEKGKAMRRALWDYYAPCRATLRELFPEEF